jgi:hypothetical protein
VCESLPTVAVDGRRVVPPELLSAIRPLKTRAHLPPTRSRDESGRLRSTGDQLGQVADERQRVM